MKRPVRFGLNADPHVDGLAAAERIAKIGDDGGVEYIGIQDHPYSPAFLDTFTLITYLAARTSDVRFFTNVANLPLRPPAMLAKQAATIDQVSGGRFELGLGAGAFSGPIAGMGGQVHDSPGVARRALSEAIDVIRTSWAGQPFSFRGKHYTLPRVQPGPIPAHGIGLWLGVIGPKAAALVGAKADGWSVSSGYVPPARAAELNKVITDAAGEAGRDPAGITRLYNVMGSIGPDGGGGGDAFNGPVSRWVDTLTTLYADHGMDTFVYWPSRDQERQSRIFAEEVAPAVRKALAGA